MKKNDTLQTPEWVYKELGYIHLDPCAGIDTKIGKINYRLEERRNGLEMPWVGFVFCNPPFSQKELWIEKMEEHNHGILLLPERGSTPWFSDLISFTKYYFVMGKKINFIGGSTSNPLGTCLFPFGEEALERLYSCNLPGHLVEVKRVRGRVCG